MMRTLLLLMVGVVAGGLLGCAPSPATNVAENDQAPTTIIDSLRDANERLQARTRQLSDSLQFYDDIQSAQYRRERRAMQDDLTRLSYELTLLRDGGQALETLRADALFEPGTARLTDDGRSRLRDLAASLRTTYRARTIRVEGHTDNRPLGEESRYTSNWDLSASRAAAVVEALIDLSELSASQFQAMAFGDAQPVASNETRSGQARNRRMRVAVLPPTRNIIHPYETSW